MAIPTTFDKARFDAITNIARSQNRNVTPEEWAGVGGDWKDYAAQTGGEPQAGPPARPFDFQEFDKIAAQAKAEGREVTPGEYASVGGTRDLYETMYPHAAVPGAQPGDPYQRPDAPVGDQYGGSGTYEGTAGEIYKGAASEREHNMELQDKANRLDESGPSGGAKYTYNPETGRTEREVYLSPEEKAIQESEQRRQAGLGSQAENLIGQMPQDKFSYDGMPEVQRTDRGELTDFGKSDFGGIKEAQWGIDRSDLSAMPNADANERMRIEDTLYQNFANRMEPRFEQEREDLTQRLANEGIPRGSEKFNDQMDQLKQQQNDAYQQAASQATSMGGQEMQRSFGMGMDVRQQEMDEKIKEFEASGMSRDRAVAEVEKSFGMKYEQRGAEWGEQKDEYSESATERERAKGEYKDERRSPYEEYNAIAGNIRGAKDPNVSAVSAINVAPIDATGIGMGVMGAEGEKYKTDVWSSTEIAKAKIAAEAEKLDVVLGGGTEGSSTTSTSSSDGPPSDGPFTHNVNDPNHPNHEYWATHPDERPPSWGRPAGPGDAQIPGTPQGELPPTSNDDYVVGDTYQPPAAPGGNVVGDGGAIDTNSLRRSTVSQQGDPYAEQQRQAEYDAGIAAGKDPNAAQQPGQMTPEQMYRQRREDSAAQFQAYQDRNGPATPQEQQAYQVQQGQMHDRYQQYIQQNPQPQQRSISTEPVGGGGMMFAGGSPGFYNQQPGTGFGGMQKPMFGGMQPMNYGQNLTGYAGGAPQLPNQNQQAMSQMYNTQMGYTPYTNTR